MRARSLYTAVSSWIINWSSERIMPFSQSIDIIVASHELVGASTVLNSTSINLDAFGMGHHSAGISNVPLKVITCSESKMTTVYKDRALTITKDLGCCINKSYQMQ